MNSGKAPPDPTEAHERPVFAATITPHRALGTAGVRLVMTLLCVVTLVSSIPFMIAGAWPVAGFFGLDLLALSIAFSVNMRAGRGFEELVLTPIELMVRRVTPRGEARAWRFNPLWTRLESEADDEFGMQVVTVVSRGERVVIARDLSPPERESLARELSRALADVKRGY
ncbi:DUF2244 domain-containing protein [Salinarimonas soli]|uniref:DUF2244 domain-containing protein n=1 Tax=Salinarimonas soli TaxID=1638099 RepID=A0A5B2VF99_9HYPH|nr:DUF2244 domain-containing protein [Salinarimonas soli]KAA2237298.1 DUF2244 domain-containing protein [Salinarimonas soli]